MSDDRLEYACAHCGATNRIPRARAKDDPTCGACKQKIFPRAPVQATDASFGREVERSPIPVLVDFWAPWCAPCRMVAPSLEAMAHEHAGRLKIVKLNVDENPRTAARFGIQSIPALKLYAGGHVVDEAVGALPRPHLEQLVARHL